MSEPLEVEQKFRVDSFTDVRKRLGDAEPLGRAEEWDTYLSHPGRDFAETGEAVRLRSVDRAQHSDSRHGEAGSGGRATLVRTNVLTYKGPRLAGPLKVRVERELTLSSDRESALAFFAAIGFEPVADVRKVRESYRFGIGGQPVTVSLDEVDGGGRFVEVEVVSTDRDAAAAGVAEVAGRLGLNNVERRSYLAIVHGHAETSEV